MTSEDDTQKPDDAASADDRHDHVQQFDGDLNFATDSTPGIRPDIPLEEIRKAQRDHEKSSSEVEIDKTWVMPDHPAERASEADFDPDSTQAFSGDPAATADSAHDDGEDESAPSVADTWVPEPDQAAASGEPDDVSQTSATSPAISAQDTAWWDAPNQHQTAPDNTAPDDTATDDTAGDASDAAQIDLDKTIALGPRENDNSNEETPDPNKTQVLPNAPTHHDYSFEKSASTAASDTDPNHDPNKTQVLSKAPTVHGEAAPKDADSTSQTATGTVVIPRDDRPAAEDESDVERTQVFRRTMSGRGVSEEEYDKWQQDVEEKAKSDTAVTGLDNPESSSTDGKRTQIWSRPSSGGLDGSLTIRSRPVEGSEEFQHSLGSSDPDYKITEKLAEGGMGSIYLANQRSLDRELAIKTLKPLREHEIRNYTSQGRMSQVQKQRREMFLAEALVTGNLVHPHIIPIHDLCQTVDGTPFYSMKRVHGTPWSETITEMTEEENLEVLHKVCDAVAYAHHNGVVNRDLKPENVMLGEFGEVLVLDWGLAVPATEADKKRFASPSATYGAGTPAYMSPELWTGPGDAIGPSSDIYLLGAILFEVITGKAPHVFPDPEPGAGNSGLWKVIDQVVRRNRIRPTDVTGELMDIALKAMSTDPAQRHASVLEFQEAVKLFQKHEESRRLSTRADETLTEARSHAHRRGYQDYQTAAALFEESHSAWPENERARSGLRETRLSYATLAWSRGDYDLGLQIATQERGTEFTELAGKLKKSRLLRNSLKSAMMVTVTVVVLIGCLSFYQAIRITRQNDQITALYGTKETLEQEKADAEAAKSQAEADTRSAEVARAAAVREQLAAVQERDAAREERQKTEAARLVAEADRVAAVQAQEKAESLRQTAVDEKAAAEAQLKDVATQVAALEVQKARAGVDLYNAEIANLIRSADYSAALRRVDELIAALATDEALEELPADEREERTQELKARRQQLLKRSVPTATPVQAQVVSPSGRLVVWGDSSGRLRVWNVEAFGQLPDTPTAELKLAEAVNCLQIHQNEDAVVAACRNEIHVWYPATGEHQQLHGLTGTVSTIQLGPDFVLAADDTGSIMAWDPATQQELWSIRSAAAIRDIALLPESRIFLYAGSRGGESSDILAYALPPESDRRARPKRLGQLRLPRDRTNPPLRLAVSPDERLLLISNSRNGQLLALPRRTEEQLTERDRFPFQHATELSQTGVSGWLLAHHQRPVNDINFCSSGRRVVTASDDRSVGIWSVDGDQLQLDEILLGHGARVTAADFLDADGDQVLSASTDRYCRFWQVSRYEEDRRAIEADFDLSLLRARILSQHARDINANPDSRVVPQRENPGPWIMTGMQAETSDKQATAPQWKPGEDYKVLNADARSQRGAIRSVTLSQDGSRVITGAADGTAVLWDTASGDVMTGVSTRAAGALHSFDEGHDFNVARLRFLPPTGKVLLTTGFDGNLCLWNADDQQAGAGSQQIRLPGLGLVNAVATSTDGRLIITSTSTDGDGPVIVARVWRTADLLSRTHPEPVAAFEGFHRAEVSAIAISRDQRRVATGARDGRIAIWSAETGERIAGGQIHARNTIVSHLQWLADDTLLSAGFDGRLQISAPDAATSGGPLETQFEFSHDLIPIERVAFANDLQQFVTISVRTSRRTDTLSYELELWDVPSRERVRRIRPAVVGGQVPDRIVSVAWSADDARLAAIVDDRLQVFSTEDWKIQRVLEAPGLGISDAVFPPPGHSGNSVATFDGTAAHLWNLKSRSHIASFRPLFAVQSTALTEVEERSLLLTGDRAIRIFQADATSDNFGQTLFKISDPHRGVVTDLAFSPDPSSNQFISTGADGSAILWRWVPETQEAIHTAWLLRDGQPLVDVAWSPDGKTILLAAEHGRITLFSAADPTEALTHFEIEAGQNVELTSAAFSSDGCCFAVAGQRLETAESTGWIFAWNPEGDKKLHATISGHEAGGITCIRFIPDSPYVATGGADGAAIIWNWQPFRTDEAPVAAYEAFQLLRDHDNVAHGAPVNSLSITSGGLIATCSNDGTAVLWKNPLR